MFSRRNFLKASGTACLLPNFACAAAAEVTPKNSVLHLKPSTFQQSHAISGGVPTEFWGFNGTIPGPELRFKKGQIARIMVSNGLLKNTTVHWHGVRVPHAMDGVPHVSQPPIAPGASFQYEFQLKDSGTFWYHPHERSYEQVGRGLFGPLIVEEDDPPAVDRDLTWVLSDFLLDPASGRHQPFGAMAAHAMNGRIGNLITINGVDINQGVRLDVARGERIRLRLINASTARVFAPAFDGHQPWVIAFDGNGVEPHPFEASRTNLGPGMRLDLIIDCPQSAGKEFFIRDAISGQRMATLGYPDKAPLRNERLPPPAALVANNFPRPNLKRAVHHSIEFKGGDSGPPTIGMIDGKDVSYQDMKQKYSVAWTVAGHAAMEESHQHEPLLVLKHNTSYILNLSNSTAFVHPIHLHGMSFQVLSYNGVAPPYPEWRDTVFMGPFDDVQIAFVADNRGDWMFHCHILEHAASGMMGIIRVE